MKNLFICALACCLLLAIWPSYNVQAAEPVSVKAKAAIIIEATTGQVLYGFHESEARPPASMAKMMTEYLVMEAIKAGEISWDEEVRISDYAGSIPGSGQLIASGELYTVEKLFHTMSIFSGNDATVALAEKVGGTEENFVKMMNEKARDIGLSDEAHFVNSTGLETVDLEKALSPLGLADQIPNMPGETLLTAHDAAKIAQRIVLDHPEVLEIASIPQEYFIESRENTLMNNYNQMLEGWSEFEGYRGAFAYQGLDGLKTGYTDAAGYCFTGTAVRDDLRLITVVMGTDNLEQRFIETAKLLDFGFEHFEKKTLIAAKSETELVKTVPVQKGIAQEVAIITESGIELFVDKDDPQEAFEYSVEMKAEEEVIAPIEQGEVLGTLTMKYASPTGEMERQINLIAADDVEKAGWFKLFFRGIGEFFSNLMDNIKGLF